MKILIMGFSKLKYMPYINFYLDNIDTKNNQVHVVYWNRDLKTENTDKYVDCILHEFQCYQEDDVSKISKINSFIKYRKYVKRVIKQEAFDFIFVLHTLPGVLFTRYLKRKYKHKYIFDYRDSTYEKFTPFKKIIGQLVDCSFATFVSSDAFRRFLPEDCKDKIYTSHNLLMDSLNHRDEKMLHGIPSNKIRIAFWGFIRHEEINKEIIQKIAMDDRFELHYYGREQQIALSLKAYARELNADNVFFHGEYQPDDRYEFVRSTDLIHNIYHDNNTMLAMGNKYYDGVIFYIPQLCMKGSYMGKSATTRGIGYECDPYDPHFTQNIFDYYSNLNSDSFHFNCDKELEHVNKEYAEGISIIKQHY